MSRLIRCVVAVVVLVPATALVGCGPSKEDSTPNPDLKTPVIPPAGHGTKGETPNDKKK